MWDVDIYVAQNMIWAECSGPPLDMQGVTERYCWSESTMEDENRPCFLLANYLID